MRKKSNKVPIEGQSSVSSKDECQKIDKTLSRYRRPFETGWREEEDAYHGNIWRNTANYRPYVNDIFRILQSELPVLTDSLPATAVNVKDPAFAQQGKNLNSAVEWVFHDQSFDIMAPSVILNSLQTGTGWIHQYYDANADGGEGKICNEILPWRNVWVSGESQFIEKSSKARFKCERSRDWLKLNYQEYADDIEKMKGIKKTEDEDDDGRTDGLETRDTSGSHSNHNTPHVYIDEDMLTLDTRYKKDFSTEAIPEEISIEEMQKEGTALEQGESPNVNKWQDHKFHLEGHLAVIADMYMSIGLDPDAGIEAAMDRIEEISQSSPEAFPEDLGVRLAILEAHVSEHAALIKENPKGHRLKYPNGWRVIEKIQDKIVYDGPSKYEHGEIPLTPFYCYRNGTIFADSEIRHILDAERMKAVMQYKEYKGLQKVANPNIIADKETDLTEDDISNEDGGVYIIPQGTDLRHMSPGQISEQVARFQEKLRESEQDISGVVEATQGKMPSPNAAAMTVHKTQQQAIGRMRLKDRQNQGYSIKRLGKMTACNIIQFWHTEKVLKLEGEGDDLAPLVFNPLEMEDVEWELEIAQGSMAGVDKDSWNSMLFTWLQSGHISFETMLAVGEFQKKEKILELTKEAMDIQGQMEALQTENLKLKSQVDPTLLSDDEAKALDELQRQEQLENISGLNNEQPPVS